MRLGTYVKVEIRLGWILDWIGPDRAGNMVHLDKLALVQVKLYCGVPSKETMDGKQRERAGKGGTKGETLGDSGLGADLWDLAVQNGIIVSF